MLIQDLMRQKSHSCSELNATMRLIALQMSWNALRDRLCAIPASPV